MLESGLGGQDREAIAANHARDLVDAAGYIRGFKQNTSGD